MPPRPQLPDQECFDCHPNGNRFMTHVDTLKEPKQGVVGDYDFIAIFQCSQVRGHTRREALDPSVL